MEKIVEEVRAGKKGSVARLYGEYSLVVKRYLRGKISRDEDVEELLQDTFISALDSLPLYRAQASFKTWILSIARHEVADWYRKRYVRQIVEKTAPLFEDMLSQMSSPEFELKKKNIKQRFYGAYHELKREYQDVLSYRYELGMSVREVSTRMEMSVKATESLLYRARVAFRLAYEQRS